MEMANQNNAEATRSSRSWIDVFAGCGTILGRLLSHLDEIDLMHVEMASDEAYQDVTVIQWAYLDQLDRKRGRITRWRQPASTSRLPSDGTAAAASDSDNNDSTQARIRGMQFARNYLYAKKRAQEAFRHFRLDSDTATPEDIPLRNPGIHLRATKRGRLEQEPPPPMPPCWNSWANLDDLSFPLGNNQHLILDVFLELSFHRDDTKEILSWRGFRKARYKIYEGLSLQLDLEVLADEMGWTELLKFRNTSLDYAFTHFEVEESQAMLKAFMQKLQVTFFRCHTNEALSEDRPSMLISTGGYAAPAWSKRGTHMVFAPNANVGGFHKRNGHDPLEGTYTDASRATFLRIPTPNSRNQTIGLILKIYD